MYSMLVNVAPVFQETTEARSRRSTKDICQSHPSEGIALETEFYIECNEDEIDEQDIPLLFHWYFRTTSNGTWQTITYPSDGISLFFQTLGWYTSWFSTDHGLLKNIIKSAMVQTNDKSINIL